MKTALIILLASMSLSAVTMDRIDSTMIRSRRMRDDGVGGFLIQQKRITPLIADSTEPIPVTMPPYEHRYVTQEKYVEDIMGMSNKINGLATTVEYLADNAANQKRLLDFLTKLFEILTPLIVIIAGLFTKKTYTAWVNKN